MAQQIIFYSWQSDLPNSTNRGFIQERLEDAIAELRSSDALQVEPVLDRDTAGVAGSPDIGLTIFSKISKAAVFVCDVSIIHDPKNGRPTPNPNVLIELGYALKTMGASRILMVMNTAYGGPEKLPFDLRQKRVLTYKLPKDGDKAEAKKSLNRLLITAIKTVLDELEESGAETAAADPSLEVIEAIKNNRPDTPRRIKAYMIWLVSELDKIDKEKFEGEEDEKLFQAIEKTIPAVKGYDTVANAISAYGVTEYANTLFKSFEFLVARYRKPRNFSGSWKTYEFDFYKFIGHELLVILIGYLMKDERWALINDVLANRIHMDNHPSGQASSIAFGMLSDHLALLDDIRSQRLVKNNERRISIHADILKERHENMPLSENLTWEEFLDADQFLCLYSIIHMGDDEYHHWWPRSWVYFGSRVPRFVVDAYSKKGASNLAHALGLKDIDELKSKLPEAIQRYQKGVLQGRSGIFSDPYWGFDGAKIGSQ